MSHALDQLGLTFRLLVVRFRVEELVEAKHCTKVSVYSGTSISSHCRRRPWGSTFLLTIIPVLLHQVLESTSVARLLVRMLLGLA
jgi:hypothetical protein